MHFCDLWGPFLAKNTDLVETTEQTEVMQEVVRDRIWVSLYTLNGSYCSVLTKIAVQTASVCALETHTFLLGLNLQLLSPEHRDRVLHNLGVCFAAMTHFLIWPHKPRRLVYRHVIYFYKPSFSILESRKNGERKTTLPVFAGCSAE